MKLKTILTHLLKDRTYLDYWSLIHFGFGIIIAFLLKLTGLSLITSIFASLALFSIWEITEPKIFKYVLKIKFTEDSTNQIMDIIYGFLGFLVYWLWL